MKSIIPWMKCNLNSQSALINLVHCHRPLCRFFRCKVLIPLKSLECQQKSIENFVKKLRDFSYNLCKLSKRIFSWCDGKKKGQMFPLLSDYKRPSTFCRYLANAWQVVVSWCSRKPWAVEHIITRVYNTIQNKTSGA